MEILYENLLKFGQADGWKNIVMILIGCLLIFLAIKKEMEPSLLLPMGIGMLVIFVIIGVIILTTMLINKIFSKKD